MLITLFTLPLFIALLVCRQQKASHALDQADTAFLANFNPRASSLPVGFCCLHQLTYFVFLTPAGRLGKLESYVLTTKVIYILKSY